ncbi:hypothetical protein [Bifidobacterium avesanii]|uniref:DUF559 domain-containing protein n=1 Tax=Bifidobacterium avesanii TaxID=1798157 RepID=A0A7K3THP2_9BIFI|nr:hypothetical protein [Bifidobacterium avesanii]KAB8292048.1 hypothetical protein DSM100685_1060 [Bifidobacterium avesanii]NEG78591.1 hypothetical protein [Bifidobacterium avesanii]
MNTESYSLESLTNVKYQRLNACAELQRRTKRRLVFARSEALELLAVEKPIEPESERRRKDMDVVVGSPGEKGRLRGIRFLTWHGPIEVIDVNRAIECTTPVCTWAHYSGLITLRELIVLGDSMMRRNRRLARAEFSDFVRYLDGDGQFLGKLNCKRALKLMREGTDSSQETRTRLTLMQYGLPEPAVNYPITLHNGRVVLADMAYPELRIAIEYDGGYHRFDSNQVLRDDKRREALEELGWLYIKVTRIDMGNEQVEETLAQRVATQCERVLGVSVPLTARMSVQQICDGRRIRRKPLWDRVPRHLWKAPWAQETAS